jgi:predicted metal-dependent hydrolase
VYLKKIKIELRKLYDFVEMAGEIGYNRRPMASEKTTEIVVEGVTVELVRKPVKNLHLRVLPPGKVRLTMPRRASERVARAMIVERLDWIRQHQAALAHKADLDREVVHGEQHYFMGELYELSIIEKAAPAQVRVKGDLIELSVRPGADCARVLEKWHREHLHQLIGEMVEEWAPKLGVRVKGWGVRKMRSRWGSCHTRDKVIWLSLELAKMPMECLEYVVVHELCHLLEASHNAALCPIGASIAIVSTDFRLSRRLRQFLKQVRFDTHTLHDLLWPAFNGPLRICSESKSDALEPIAPPEVVEPAGHHLSLAHLKVGPVRYHFWETIYMSNLAISADRVVFLIRIEDKAQDGIALFCAYFTQCVLGPQMGASQQRQITKRLCHLVIKVFIEIHPCLA